MVFFQCYFQSHFYLRVKRDFFQHVRNPETLVHDAFKNRRFAAVVNLPGQRLGLRRIAACRFDDLMNDLVERMLFVVEQYDYCRLIDQHVDVFLFLL
jgi:hypothetical protein